MRDPCHEFVDPCSPASAPRSQACRQLGRRHDSAKPSAKCTFWGLWKMHNSPSHTNGVPGGGIVHFPETPESVLCQELVQPGSSEQGWMSKAQLACRVSPPDFPSPYITGLPPSKFICHRVLINARRILAIIDCSH